jgi:hypothetical protein
VKEEDSVTYGRTSNNRLETAWQSVPTAQETGNVGDPLWPTFDAGTARNLNLNIKLMDALVAIEN